MVLEMRSGLDAYYIAISDTTVTPRRTEISRSIGASTQFMRIFCAAPDTADVERRNDVVVKGSVDGRWEALVTLVHNMHSRFQLMSTQVVCQ